MTAQSQDPFEEAMASLKMRKAWAESLCFALGECHPKDAATICTAFLQDQETGGPEPAFGPIRRDAQWWAETAPAHELQEYTAAGMKALAGKALGPSARRRFIAELWSGLDPADRAAFIARVTA